MKPNRTPHQLLRLFDRAVVRTFRRRAQVPPIQVLSTLVPGMIGFEKRTLPRAPSDLDREYYRKRYLVALRVATHRGRELLDALGSRALDCPGFIDFICMLESQRTIEAESAWPRIEKYLRILTAQQQMEAAKSTSGEVETSDHRSNLASIRSAAPKPQPRMKRSIAEPLIAEHLQRRPYDRVKDVAAAVRCSTGLVSGSKAWKLNRQRLRNARRFGVDPVAIRLDERSIQAVTNGESTEQLDEHIDARESALSRRIADYRHAHPGASNADVAQAIGCTPEEVRRRDETLARLTEEQRKDAKSDPSLIDPGKPLQWIRKQV